MPRAVSRSILHRPSLSLRRPRTSPSAHTIRGWPSLSSRSRRTLLEAMASSDATAALAASTPPADSSASRTRRMPLPSGESSDPREAASRVAEGAGGRTPLAAAAAPAGAALRSAEDISSSSASSIMESRAGAGNESTPLSNSAAAATSGSTSPVSTAVRSRRTLAARGAQRMSMMSWHTTMGQPRSCVSMVPRILIFDPGAARRASSRTASASKSTRFAERMA